MKTLKSANELFALDVAGVPLYVNKSENEIIAYKLAWAFCSMHNYNGCRKNTHALYLLRGGTDRKENLLFGLLEVSRFPEPLLAVIDLLQAYNHSGPELFTICKQGAEDYRGFVLRSLDNECARIVRTTADKYISGRGQNHVWIGERSSGKRILVMHF